MVSDYQVICSLEKSPFPALAATNLLRHATLGDASDGDDDGGDGDDDASDGDDDIYIMMKCLSVCLSVTKNHHFLLGVSCIHLNPP